MADSRPAGAVIDPAPRVSRISSFVNRQAKVEAASRSVVSNGPESPAMCLDDRSTDRQTHADALHFCRVERIKYPGRMFRIYTHARILDEDDDTVRRLLLCSNAQDLRPISDNAHRFHGIHDQIQNHLLEQDPIRHYRRKVGRHFRPRGRPVSTKFTVQQGNDFPNQLIDIQALPQSFPPPEKAANPHQYAAGPSSIPNDGLHGLLRLLQVGRFGGEPSQTSISTHDNTAQWLVEFMSNRSRKFAHCRYPCDASNFGLRPEQTLLCRLPFGNF